MRPRKTKCIEFDPRVTFFKPAGISLKRLEHVHVSREELEALRLANLEELSQKDIAKRMNTHQSTAQRLLKSARKKLTESLIHGKAICLEEGCVK